MTVTIKDLLHETLSEKRARAGRRGGRANVATHSPEHFSRIGKLGGRPRLLTIEELMKRRVTL